MKNGELYGVKMVLEEIIKLARSGKLIYAVNKNLERVGREIRNLETVKKTPQKFGEFDQKRVKLCLEHTAKDDKGAPKTKQGTFGLEFDIVDRPAFDKALEVLREEYKDTLAEYQEGVERFNKMMDQENDELKLYKVKYSIFEKEQAELKPEDRLNGEQVRSIWFMIEDDLDTEAKPEQEKPELKMVK